MKKVTDPALILRSHTLQSTNRDKFSQRQSIQLFPIKPSHALTQKPKIQTGLKQLEAQADKINQLSAKIEAAIGEFRAIATQVNQDSRLLRSKRRGSKPYSICEYRETVVPVVRQKSSGRFVLMSRSVNFVTAETNQ